MTQRNDSGEKSQPVPWEQQVRSSLALTHASNKASDGQLTAVFKTTKMNKTFTFQGWRTLKAVIPVSTYIGTPT